MVCACYSSRHAVEVATKLANRPFRTRTQPLRAVLVLVLVLDASPEFISRSRNTSTAALR
jgi:hypothetical protein